MELNETFRRISDITIYENLASYTIKRKFYQHIFFDIPHLKNCYIEFDVHNQIIIMNYNTLYVKTEVKTNLILRSNFS